MAPTKPRNNRSSRLLTLEENNLLFRLITPSCESLGTSVVQLYISAPPDHQRWEKYACGVVCFVKNYETHSFYIRLYDLFEEATCVWEQELYNEIEYRAYTMKATFHAFEADQCMAGLNFADQAEASEFYDVVQQKVQMLKRKSTKTMENGSNAHLSRRDAIKTKSTAKHVDGHHFETVPASPSTHKLFDAFASKQGVQISAPTPVDPKSVKYGKSDKQSKYTFGKKKGKMTAADISGPVRETFQHVAHMGFDATKGYVADKNNPIIAKLLEASNIDINNLNKDDEEFVYQFIDKQLGGVEAVRTAASAPVHEPPVYHAPPPPSHHTRHEPPRLPPARNVPPPLLLVPAADKRMRQGSMENINRIQPHDPRNTLAPPPPPRRGGSLSDITKSQPPPPTFAPPLPPPAGMAPPPPPPPPPAPAGPGIRPASGPPRISSAEFPPPPTPGTLALAEGAGNSDNHGGSRSSLLAEVRKGVSLKPVSRDGSFSDSGSVRDRLMADIKSGQNTLKRVNPEDRPAKPVSTELSGMAAALERALMNRRTAIEVEENSDEEDWDS